MENSRPPSATIDKPMGTLDFSRICRCCLSNSNELKAIFTSVGSVPGAVFVFTSVKFVENDGLPGTICANCLNHLNKCISFKRKVEATDLLLRKCIAEWKHKSTVDSRGTMPNRDNEKYLNSNSKPLDEEVKKAKHAESKKNETTPILTDSYDSLNSYICSKCERTYSSRYAYNRHMKVHISAGRTLRCNECGKKFADENILESHQICHIQNKGTNNDEQMFICQICKAAFTVEQDLYIHSSLHENTNNLNCKACGKHFEVMSKLKRHIPTHFTNKPFKCNNCDMSFAEMASLTRHYKKHTEKLQIPNHVCLVCNKSFRSQYSLKIHMRNHTGDRPWKCTKCERQFTDYRLLNSHKKLHNEEKQYQCQECQNKFRHKSTLTTHMRTHTGDRPYRCDKCKKSYKQLRVLRLHKRAHQSKKRLLCDECSQIFISAASLKSHIQWHENQATSDDKDDKNPQTNSSAESFKCTRCLAQFRSLLDLITHEKLTHVLIHECDICLSKWKTVEELEQHKCNQTIEISNEVAPEELILLPNGEIRDCNTIVNDLLATTYFSSNCNGK